jgi:hypothetical protein
LLFGDPAMQLKVPIPRRPTRLAAEQEGRNNVSLSWQSATDADGNAAAGYNVYRKTATDVGYTLINSQPVTAAGFSDNNLAIGTRYYYVVRAVDADGLESVDSESVSIVPSDPAASLTGSGSGAAAPLACFVSTANDDGKFDGMGGLALLGLLIILGLIIGARLTAQGVRSMFYRWAAQLYIRSGSGFPATM